MSDASQGSGDSASLEQTFAMDPHETLLTLARNLVAGQRTIAELCRSAATLRANAPTTMDPEIIGLLAGFDHTIQQWHAEALPSMIASMKLALEVYDTFGPGMTTVEDPTDAAIWNNKYFAWVWELSGRPTQ